MVDKEDFEKDINVPNKEIIIDGINVSECEYLQYKGCEFAQCLIKMASFDLKCEDYNCYYKQLKRKEQECEELISEKDFYLQKIETLEDKCEELEEKLNAQFVEMEEKLTAEEMKKCELKEEIKEVLQFYNNITIGTDKGNGTFEFEVYNDNILGEKLIYCYDTNPAKRALQKISKCEVSND